MQRKPYNESQPYYTDNQKYAFRMCYHRCLFCNGFRTVHIDYLDLFYFFCQFFLLSLPDQIIQILQPRFQQFFIYYFQNALWF